MDRDLANDRALANAERAWLEPPDDRRPAGVEDVEGMVIFMPGVWEPGTTLAEVAEWEDFDPDLFGIIDGFEEWEDAERDEDGYARRYGGVTLQVQSLYSKLTGSVELDNVDEYMIPKEWKAMRTAGEAAEQAYKAEQAATSARYNYERQWVYRRHELAQEVKTNG